MVTLPGQCPLGTVSEARRGGRQSRMPYLWSLHVQRFIRGAEVHQGRRTSSSSTSASPIFLVCSSTSTSRRRPSTRSSSPSASCSTAPRSAVSRIDPRVGHAAHPRRVDRVRRPVPRCERTLIMVFDIYNPRNGEIYSQGPASGRQEGREVPRLDRHRRHRVLRPRGRVLHLRRRALRGEAELELLLRRLRGRRLEHAAATKRAATSPTRPRTRAATSRSAPVDKHGRPARRHHASS